MPSYRQCRLSTGAVVGVGCLEDCIKCLLSSISHFLIEHVSFEGIWFTSVVCKVSESIQPWRHCCQPWAAGKLRMNTWGIWAYLISLACLHIARRYSEAPLFVTCLINLRACMPWHISAGEGRSPCPLFLQLSPSAWLWEICCPAFWLLHQLSLERFHHPHLPVQQSHQARILRAKCSGWITKHRQSLGYSDSCIVRLLGATSSFADVASSSFRLFANFANIST